MSTDQQEFSVTILVKVSNDIINQAPTSPGGVAGLNKGVCLEGMLTFHNRCVYNWFLYKKVSVSKGSDRCLNDICPYHQCK